MTSTGAAASLTVPANARYAGLVRTAVFEMVSLAAGSDAAVEAAAAASEAFSLTDLGASSAVCMIRVETTASGADVSISGPSRGEPDEETADAREFADAIMTSLIGEHDVVVASGSVTTTFSKRSAGV